MIIHNVNHIHRFHHLACEQKYTASVIVLNVLKLSLLGKIAVCLVLSFAYPHCTACLLLTKLILNCFECILFTRDEKNKLAAESSLGKLVRTFERLCIKQFHERYA